MLKGFFPVFGCFMQYDKLLLEFGMDFRIDVNRIPVSYTHLDVYKRQNEVSVGCHTFEHPSRCSSCARTKFKKFSCEFAGHKRPKKCPSEVIGRLTKADSCGIGGDGG